MTVPMPESIMSESMMAESVMAEPMMVAEPVMVSEPVMAEAMATPLHLIDRRIAGNGGRRRDRKRSRLKRCGRSGRKSADERSSEKRLAQSCT